MIKKIYIYTNNHKSKLGIKIHITFLKKIFKNYKIILTNKIHNNSTNILIENFSNNDVKYILKKRKNAKLIFLLTEFFNSKAKIFNCFELNKPYFRYVPFQYLYPITLLLILNFFIFLFYFFYKINEIFYFLAIVNIHYLFTKVSKSQILMKWYKKNKKKFYKKIIKDKYAYRKSSIHDLIDFLEYILVNSMSSFNNYLKIINEFIENSWFYDKIVTYQYFKERYLNCQKIIRHADIILVTHPAIFNEYKIYNKNIYYLFPKIKKFKPNTKVSKNFIFKFSGKYSRYRNAYFNTLIEKINNNKLYDDKFKRYINSFKKKLSKVRVDSFIDEPNSRKFKYSLHPRKNNIWYFSSPIRYLEAIDKGEIPIVIDKFKDFFTKNLSINIKFLLDKNKNFEKNYFFNINLINKKLKNYNKFSKINIKKLKKNIF